MGWTVGLLHNPFLMASFLVSNHQQLAKRTKRALERTLKDLALNMLDKISPKFVFVLENFKNQSNMKKNIIILPAFTLLLLACLPPLTAQDIQGGKITYEQIVNYNLEGAFDDPRWDNYIADLPKTGKSIHLLSFTKDQAFYEEDLSQKDAMSKQLQGAIMKANYSKKPKAIVKKTWYSFEKNEHIEQREFMTRFFLVESEIERKAWKLTNKKKKVLDYVCLGADLEFGDEIITAWFTSEIPVSAGPGDYYGLPGLILGVEKNEEVFILATSIDLTPPDESTLNQLDKGQKVSPEKFDQIVIEKMEEYQKMMQSKSKNRSKTKG